jgi:hypothetical protein
LEFRVPTEQAPFQLPGEVRVCLELVRRLQTPGQCDQFIYFRVALESWLR